MQTTRSLALVTGLCLAVLFGFYPRSSAQDVADQETAQASLTFEVYPDYRYDDDFVLKPDSPLLIRFNAAVDPSTVPLFVRIRDQETEQQIAVIATRPSETEALHLMQRKSLDDIALESLVLLKPAQPLFFGHWSLYIPAGLSSADGTHAVAEGALKNIGKLEPFEIVQVSTEHGYDEPLEMVIDLNKRFLAPEFRDPKHLAEFVTVSPAPADLQIVAERRRILLRGAFEYGVEYSVKVREGLVAYDTIRLDQSFTEQVAFAPNEGFLTYPAFSTTQSATGHRNFTVKSGNLTGMRTRVKKLEGKDLITGLREYGEKYEGWGEKQSLTFESMPGRTIYDEFHDAEGKVDRAESIVYDWTKLSDSPDPGAYYICSEGSSATVDDLQMGAQALVQLTDIGLAWKQGAEGTMIYGFSLQSGAAIAGLKIELLDHQGEKLTNTETDKDGLARIDLQYYADKEENLYLDASIAKDRHIMSFREDMNDISTWRFGIDQRWDKLIEGEQRTLIFTDRDVYRPGDEVKVKIISRLVNEDSLIGPKTGTARLIVFDGKNRKIVDKDITLSATGSYDDSFTLPAEGMGWHSLQIDFAPRPAEGEDAGSDWRLVEDYSFQVQDYRVNTFEVTVGAEDEYKSTDKFKIPVSAKYFMGKPLTKAEMNWTVEASTSYPSLRGFSNFEFGDNIDDEDDSFTTAGTARLSSDGSATAAFTLPDNSTRPAPQEVHLIAAVTDANQQTLSGSKRFVVHSSDFYLGLSLPEDAERAGEEFLFSFAAVQTNGEPLTSAVDTTVLVEKEEWSTVRVMGANGKPSYRNELRLRTISDDHIALKTGVDAATGIPSPMAHPMIFAEAGDYQISLMAKDAEGRDVLTKKRIHVIGAEEPSWSWHDVTRIDLIPDKENYKVGDTAKLLARSPVFGNALFTVERGGVREARAVEITQYETVFEVPITQDDAPNVYASLLIIRGSAHSPRVHAAADCRLGYCEIQVTDPAATLVAKLSAGDAPYYQPGEEITFSAEVTDHQGQPVSGAEVTLYAVDEGVLSLSGYQTPNPGETFQASFPLSVWTGESIGSLLPENPLEQEFYNKGYVIGDGGGFGIDPERIRKNFQALALWEGSLKTDAQGRVQAKAIAPDNLTAFRVMAVVAEGNRFGSGDSQVVVNKPLIIEPALPRFTNLGDQIDIAAVLHNNSDNDQDVEVEVSLDGHAIFIDRIGEKLVTSLSDEPSSPSSKKASIRVPAGATETLSFPIGIVATGEAQWVWRARSATDEKLRDAVESKFEVVYPLPLLRETHSLTLRDGKALPDALSQVDSSIRTGSGTLQVKLSNSRLIDGTDGLDYLLQYPYGCAEQLLSTTVPWLTSQQLRRVLPDLDQSEEHVCSVIEKALNRVLDMQTDDGGIGYWPGSSESMLWVSAYAGMVIAMAEKQGFTFPEHSVSSLRIYLAASMRGTADLTKPYDLSQRCLAAYALALAGEDQSEYHEVLFKKHKQLSSEARSLLALAIAESGQKRTDWIDTLLSPDPKVPVAEVSWYRQPYIAAARLLAKVRVNPDDPAIDGLVDDLLKLREMNNGWGGTYSNAWPLIALAAYSESSAKVTANEIELIFQENSKQISLPSAPTGAGTEFAFSKSDKGGDLEIRPKDSGAVYANVNIAARPSLAPMDPENHGFQIRRSYQKVEVDGSIVPAENLMVGDLVLITLDLNLSNAKENFLAIDDALPAIFEAVNPDFRTNETQQISATSTARTLYTNYREMRADRVLFFCNTVYGAGDYTLRYLARVVAPGQVTAPPAKVEAMYEPQRYGLSGTEQISATARPLPSGKVATR